MRPTLACLAFITLLGVAPTVFGRAPEPASKGAPPVLDCPDAARLPANASAESRRITCEIPADLRFLVMQAEFDGYLLRQLDLAAWKTTDALVEAKAFESVPGGARLGWLTRAGDTGVDVAYFTEQDGKPHAYAEARYDFASGAVSGARRLSSLRPATEREAAQLKARALATSVAGLNCTTRPNAAIIETDTGTGPEIRVYVLSAWTDELAPLGGHHRYRVSRDGSRVLDHFSQTSACLNLKNDELKQSVALPVSDIQSLAPTDIHVFLSLQYGRPLYVYTQRNDTIWKVEGSRIRLMAQDDELRPTILSWKAGIPPLQLDDEPGEEPPPQPASPDKEEP